MSSVWARTGKHSTGTQKKKKTLRKQKTSLHVQIVFMLIDKCVLSVCSYQLHGLMWAN